MGLELLGVRKSYGTVEVLSGVDLEVGGGECVVVLGPSGCGKSTLLRLISGLEVLDSGVISCNGRDLCPLPARSRNAALVFQHYALYEHKSVFENIAYPLRLRRVQDLKIKKRVESILRELNLLDIADRLPTTLSGGEQQRVALGRALVREPDVFLLDEPLSSLDPSMRQGLRRQLQQVYRSLRVPTIHVTHDQEEAMLLGDRIAVLFDGRIQQCGSAAELIESPSTVGVARFLGSPSINILRCKLQLTDNRAYAKLDTDYALPITAWSTDWTVDEVLCGIRPWSFQFKNDGLEGKVLSRRLVPPHLRFEVETLRRAQKDVVTVVSNQSCDFFEGDVVKLAVEHSPLWFNSKSGSLLASWRD